MDQAAKVLSETFLSAWLLLLGEFWGLILYFNNIEQWEIQDKNSYFFTELNHIDYYKRTSAWTALKTEWTNGRLTTNIGIYIVCVYFEKDLEKVCQT